MRKNKIFITGFRHSGTTLLMSLINHHPDIDTIYFEKDIITVSPDRQWMKYYTKNRFKSHWGDKVPWYKDTGDVAVQKCKKWIRYFKPNARVIHIIRHPIDVALSNTLRNPDPSLVKKQLDKYSESVPKVIEYVNKTQYGINVLFEELVFETNKVLKDVYEFCDIKSDKKTINKIKKNIIGGIKEHKAFNYKSLGLEYHISHFTYDEILKKVKK